ncbi:LAQU0S09e00980g1_1 [Lachancea quebecensis]|uniref:LAQU0S09e00980g1_1 n=1 Tax=Lachancea quebecensis TaxID=1654605 RepID=A0A0P1KTN9_9SACH|nr:LAQU0S09e00980g1_1 [Lachancea quebecensis]
MSSPKPISLKVNAALFDVDGTIIISQPATNAFWRDFAKDKPYFVVDEVLKVSHGCRTFDIISRFAPDFADEAKVAEMEALIPAKYGEHSIEVPGAVGLCNKLNALPKEKWAVATSGTRGLAVQWFELLGISKPTYFITANDVKQGKPFPEPYLKGRNGLGYPVNEKEPSKSKAIVFEDAPAGVAAGKAAGCKVIGIATTFDLDYLKQHDCDIIVKDLSAVRIGGYDADADEVEFIFDDYLYAKDDILTW